MKFGFDQDHAGDPPKNFSFEITGKGPAVKWQVHEDASAPSKPHVLAQLGHAERGNNFPLAVLDKTTLKNGEISVRFKAVAGEEDQAGGLVWRYQDARNYYIARANANEDNCTIYYVKNGRRRPFGNADLKVASQVWHELRVALQDDVFRLSFDGKLVVTARDKTFQKPGRAGLWTKADSVTYFDDFELVSHDAAPSR